MFLIWKVGTLFTTIGVPERGETDKDLDIWNSKRIYFSLVY